MATLGFFPPQGDILQSMMALPNLKAAPTMLITQHGPDGDAGPESAGAILILQATFTDSDGARGFWEAAVPLMGMLATAPGFIRRYTFADGLAFNLIALWRTAADARRFAASPEHRATSRALYENRWQYTHFAAIWEMTSAPQRIVFCDRCEGVTPISEGVCSTCGAELTDVYRLPASV